MHILHSRAVRKNHLISLAALSIICFPDSISEVSAQSIQAQPGALNTNRLPPVRTDSFVQQAGAMAEDIYGDEGVGGIEKKGGNIGIFHPGKLPPFENFTRANRIDTGIVGQRAAGLTTGHGSFMPCAWGADEYIGNEWAMTGNAAIPYYLPPQPLPLLPPLQTLAPPNQDNSLPVEHTHYSPPVQRLLSTLDSGF